MSIDKIASEAHWERRRFIKFLGRGTAVAASSALLPAFTSCNSGAPNEAPVSLLKGLLPQQQDDVVLAEGLSYEVLFKWGDQLNSTESIGFNNDYLCFLPLNDKGTDGLLWVNHEYISTQFVTGDVAKENKTKEQVDNEMKAVGGSIVRIKQADNGSWKMVENDPLNKRIDALTPLEIVAERPIQGSTKAIGTSGNCAGGYTPWGTILTCEEGHIYFHGDISYDTGERTVIDEGSFGWEKYYDHPPEHYGWVVEIDPKTGKGKKLTGLGRFMHESATVRQAQDGRCAVYSGDDQHDQCVYKFIADKPDSLDSGKLYVANIEEGRWISLVYEEQVVLQANFKDQTDVLIRCREAAALVGGSLLDRPEDIAVDPLTGGVLVTLTNNVPKGNYHGSILRIMEADNNPLALTFEAKTFVAGGAETGFSCPDNIEFDRNGNLWMATDISGKLMNKDEKYKAFGNNSLFVFPAKGKQAGQAIRVATAPNDAEFTGVFFSPNQKTMFVSVQHPGERSKSMEALTSHWPEGGENIPKSAVITISGPLLERLIG